MAQDKIKRIPSIHITQGVLRDILKVHLPFDVDNLVKEIMQAGKLYPLNHRKILATNQNLAKKAEKLNLSHTDKAMLFSQVLTMCRKQLRHVGINIIKPGSKDWLMIKEGAKLALSFCEDFDLPQKKGYTIYCNIGLEKMSKFALTKFNTLHPQICEAYKATLDMKGISVEATERVHKLYRQKIIDRTGSCIDYSKTPEKYIYFSTVALKCKELGLSIEHYIQAQFEGLEWAQGIPEPTQLVGIKAEERLQRYMFKNKIKAGKADEGSKKIDWGKIKAKRK